MIMFHNLLAAEESRRKAIDELLPLPLDPVFANNGKIIVSNSLNGAANFNKTFTEPGSLDALWGPLVQMRLSACLIAEPVNESLDELLATWREEVTDKDFGEDSCMTISWPSRDSRAAEIFYRHNFHPYTALAVCAPLRETHAEAKFTDLKIRSATLQDAEEITDLWCELVSYDSSFGSIYSRDGMRDVLAAKVRAAVADAACGWTLLAEVGAKTVGFVQVSSKARSSWIADRVSVNPSAYLEGLCVAEEVRGTGIGRALANAAHAEIKAAGIKACLLHYALANPLSAPFWNTMGYRPLWTTWRIQPANSWRW
jgi:GNAT superfamily N-acetyltransferase